MATPTSSIDLLQLVRKSGLVAEAQLDSWIGLNPALPEHVHATAAKLVQDGILTTFHARHLLTGKYKGFVLGQYKILDQIGAGGMGVVFLGEHRAMKRRVAIKVLPGEKADDRESLERFYREARVVSALNHPNIVRNYDVDQSGDVHFMVMEYIDGESLEHLVRRKGPLPIEEAADYISQAANGLQHAFDCGLIHRDIKPDNLLVDKTGVLKILDMGLARFFQEESTLTCELGTGAAIGTADYMAPEQALNSHDVDIRADIYSLGATFYTLLTGQAPFALETVAQKLLAHHLREPVPLAEKRDDIPPELADVVSMMMAKRPDDRFQTPGEIVAALGLWAAPRFTSATPTAKISGTWVDMEAPLHKLPRRRPRWVFPAAIAAAVAVVGIAIALAMSGGPSDSTAPAPKRPEFKDYVAPEAQRPAPIAARAFPSREVSRFVGHTDAVERLALSPDRKKMLTCGKDSLKLWDVEKATVIRELTGHQNRVLFASFDAAGKRAVSSSFDGTLRIWNLDDGREIGKLAFPGVRFWSAVFTPDGKQVFSGSHDGIARLWDLETQYIVRNMDGHTKDINWVGVSPDGKLGYTASWDGTARLWDLATGEEVAKFDKQGGPIHSLVVSPDGRFLVTGGGTKLCILDAATGREIRSLTAPDMTIAYAIAFSPDQRLIAAAGEDKKIRVWQAATGELLEAFGDFPEVVTDLAFLDATHLVSSSFDKTVRKWALGHRARKLPSAESKP